MDISQDGQNMKTIKQRRNKQLRKKKIITNLLRPFGKYTFECGLTFLNSLIRKSVLYGSEAMYNITKKGMREIERIEEAQMKKKNI